MLAQQLNQFVVNGEIVDKGIVKFTKYSVNQVAEKIILICLAVQILAPGVVFPMQGNPKLAITTTAPAKRPHDGDGQMASVSGRGVGGIGGGSSNQSMSSSNQMGSGNQSMNSSNTMGNNTNQGIRSGMGNSGVNQQINSTMQKPMMNQMNQQQNQSIQPTQQKPMGIGMGHQQSPRNMGGYANQQSPSTGPVSVFLIKSLSPYQNKWTIKARVLQKSDIKTWKNAKSEGKLFSVVFKDATGEIKATCFGDAVDQFYSLLEENSVYYISKAQIKIAKKQFNNVDNDYEMNLDQNTQITFCTEGTENIPDFIGVVKDVGDCSTLLSKAQKEYTKRELFVVDETGHQVKVTIFGKMAENFNASDASVIAVKAAKISDYQGRAFSIGMGSTISLNPDIQEAYALKGWYDNNSNTTFQKYIGGGDGAGGYPDIYKTISNAKNDAMASEKGDTFTVVGMVSYLKTENLSYPACATEGCNKKVFEENEGSWRCEKCAKSFPAPIYSILDSTGQIWATAFNDIGEIFFGISASELNELKVYLILIQDSNSAKFTELVQSKYYHQFAFKLRSKHETYNDELKLRSNVLSMTPVDPSAECDRLLQIIAQY